MGFGVGDEFGDALDWNRKIYLHGKCATADARDRRDVADEIEVELVVERRADRMCGKDKQQCMAVSRRTYNRLGRDIRTLARPVLDDEWLAESLRQPLGNQARRDVGSAPRGKAD